ncbi:hypothetical protein [Duganella hordei]|uniref:hypothetical protein n=1 Tax=Duganella hordei TaxID=2865934 RepID=UPI0030EA30EF
MAVLPLGAALPDPPEPAPAPRPRPPSLPPRPASPPVATAQGIAARPATAPATRPVAQRGTTGAATSGTPARQDASQQQPTGSAISVAIPPGLDGGGGGRGDGHDDGQQTGLAPPAASGGDQFDSDMLLDLLPTDGDSGIFEILLPNGDKLGVMADVSRNSASFLLSAGGDKLRDWLRRKQMELQTGLMRRMSRPVRLAVL